VTNHTAYIVDCGDGVARQLVLACVALAGLRHIFITHHHSDHHADYGNLMLLAWAAGLRTPVDTWGPPPLEKMTRRPEVTWYHVETTTYAGIPSQRRRTRCARSAPVRPGPHLGLLAWIFGSGAQRPIYLRSWWVRAGLALLLLGSAPLMAIIVAAKVGLWPDPNPNPIGPGMLFFFAGVVATGCGDRRGVGLAGPPAGQLRLFSNQWWA
jgi:metallo-beta-lactamase superfamily protein